MATTVRDQLVAIMTGRAADPHGWVESIRLGDRRGSNHALHLFYDVVDDFVARRARFQEAHREHIRKAFERRELVLASALTTRWMALC